MSHYESATLEYANACKEMLNNALNDVNRIEKSVTSALKNSTLLLDDNISSMIAAIQAETETTRIAIEKRTASLGTKAYSSEIGATREFLSSVNSLTLRAGSLNTALNEALYAKLNEVPPREGLDKYLSTVDDPKLSSMISVLSRNRRHDALSLDELAELAKSKIDPTYKISPKLLKDTASEVRARMKEERLSEDTISKVVDSNEARSPLELMNEATNEILDETMRRNAVQAIINSISSRGFIIDRKNIRHHKEDDTVRIMAMKPGGQKAEFSIDIRGKFMYHFQGYEGSACEKDISPMEKMLEEVYGIKMTDRQTIWVNPDKMTNKYHNEMKVKRQ